MVGTAKRRPCVPTRASARTGKDILGDVVFKRPLTQVQYQHNQYAPPMKRVKTCHIEQQHSLPKQTVGMARSKSSFPATSSCPFTSGSGSGVVQPVPAPAQLLKDGFADEAVPQQHAGHDMFEQSINDMMVLQTTNLEMPMLEGAEDAEGAEDPGAWLARTRPSDRSTNLSVPAQGQLYPSPISYQLFSPQGFSSAQGFTPHAPPMSDSTMTRSNTNSTANQSMTGPLQMLRLDSASSVSDIMPPPDTPGRKRPAPNDADLLGIASPPTMAPGPNASCQYNMGRSVSIDSRSSGQQLPHRCVMDRRGSLQDHAVPRAMLAEKRLSGLLVGGVASGAGAGQGGEAMMRSISSSSAQSTTSQSQRERAKDSLHRQINLGATQAILPKPKVDPADPDAGSQADAKTGAEGKIAVPKSGYQRPQRPKIMCTECHEHPDGFRGEHELRRHRSAKHATTRKRWICVCPSEDKMETKPLVPFKGCKACGQGKTYGQYYNAAAHIRRAHFKEKAPRGKKTGKGNDEPGEKRGGQGGGDWPPMEELKRLWLKEVETMPYADHGNDATTVSNDDDVQDLDLDLVNEADYSMSWKGASGPFPDILGVGSSGNLQLENDAVDDGDFNDLNYITVTGAFDPGMVPPIGSANFDFNNPAHPGFHHELPLEVVNMFSTHQVPGPVPSSASTLTPYVSFGDGCSQSVQGSTHPTTMTTMSQQSQQGMFSDIQYELTGFPGDGEQVGSDYPVHHHQAM